MTRAVPVQGRKRAEPGAESPQPANEARDHVQHQDGQEAREAMVHPVPHLVAGDPVREIREGPRERVQAQPSLA